eukprot:361809-Chlamydomonas_euryale.AAC.10
MLCTCGAGCVDTRLPAQSWACPTAHHVRPHMHAEHLRLRSRVCGHADRAAHGVGVGAACAPKKCVLALAGVQPSVRAWGPRCT